MNTFYMSITKTKNKMHYFLFENIKNKEHNISRYGKEEDF